MVLIPFLSLGLIGYFSAWVVNPGVALTLHAFDLAEWASLHPVVRAEPMLITTLLLRLPLLCFAYSRLVRAYAGKRSFCLPAYGRCDYVSCCHCLTF
ncbi:MAG: hypothetical protein U0670_12340 [Anaerolineae bacterium]